MASWYVIESIRKRKKYSAPFFFSRKDYNCTTIKILHYKLLFRYPELISSISLLIEVALLFITIIKILVLIAGN